jgi:predicted tellurium resistance membrane protein TerC
MIKLMERFPVIVVIGAGLIGWVGGEAIISDRVLHDAVAANPWSRYIAAVIGAAFVVGVGKAIQSRSRTKSA